MICYSRRMFARTMVALLALAMEMASASGQTTRNLRLTTTDDVGIIGTYYPVARDSAPAVLFLHALTSNRSEWAGFAALLQRNGIAALTIDFRGHGESTRKLTAEGPVTIALSSLTSQDLQNMLLDVEAAVDWLQSQSEIDKKHIALVGSSFGANIAVRYAAINDEIAGLALLSPGVNYRGIRTDDVIAQLNARPLHIFVSRNDAFAFESSKHLIEIRKELGVQTVDKELTISTGDLHGTAMLLGVKNLPQILLSWLKQVLLGLPGPERGEHPATPTAVPSNRPAPASPSK